MQASLCAYFKIVCIVCCAELIFAALICHCPGMQHSGEFSRLVAQVKSRVGTSRRAQQIKQEQEKEQEAAAEETSHEGKANKARPVPSVSDTCAAYR